MIKHTQSQLNNSVLHMYIIYLHLTFVANYVSVCMQVNDTVHAQYTLCNSKLHMLFHPVLDILTGHCWPEYTRWSRRKLC